MPKGMNDRSANEIAHGGIQNPQMCLIFIITTGISLEKNLNQEFVQF